MEPLISVIVPVYNVENYVSQCIESIINQTYKKIEIILINDGSTDSSKEICVKYAQKDQRIKIVDKKNGGLSDARNAGIKCMTGDYLMFVDSDDWLEFNCIELLYKLLIKYNADLVIGGVRKIEDETGEIIWTTKSGTISTIIFDKKQDAMKDMFQNGCASWARLYKTKIHKDILFPVGEINEDEAIVLDVLDKCQKVVKTNEVIYNYRYRKQSITSTRWHIKKIAWYEHCKDNLKFVEERYPDLKKYAEARYISSLVWVLNNMSQNVKEYNTYIEKYRKELKYIIRNSEYKKELSNKERARVFLLAYMYYPYAKIIKILGKSYT